MGIVVNRAVVTAGFAGIGEFLFDANQVECVYDVATIGMHSKRE